MSYTFKEAELIYALQQTTVLLAILAAELVQREAMPETAKILLDRVEANNALLKGVRI